MEEVWKEEVMAQYTNLDTSESVIHDTILRLKRLSVSDAEAATRSVMAYMGFATDTADTPFEDGDEDD